MTKKTRIIGLVVLVLVALFSAAYYFVMNSGARDLNTESAVFTVASATICKEFASDSESANKKYLEKAVAVSGTITSINNLEIILDNMVICNLLKTEKALKIKQNITLKGRIVGYDDLMGEVKLDQCVINK